MELAEIDILFEGTYNYKDGFYNITINKTTITKNNYHEPELKGYAKKSQKLKSIECPINFKKDFFSNKETSKD